jgi:hypothetical protein
LQFQATGIGSNYVRATKITLLELDNQRLRVGEIGNYTPAIANLYDLSITNGAVTKKPTQLYSSQGVDLLVEVLEVAILKDLTTEENSSLSNYVELIPDDPGPSIDEVE